MQTLAAAGRPGRKFFDPSSLPRRIRLTLVGTLRMMAGLRPQASSQITAGAVPTEELDLE